MQYSREEMQGCSLSTIIMQVASSLNIIKGHGMKKEGKREDFKEVCQLLNLPLVSS